MAVWPAGLPQLQVANLAEQAPMNFIRTQMDTGPPKMRQRYTANVRPIRGELVLTTAQRATLDAFYTGTLASVLPFDWVHPITQAPATFRFVSPPIYSTLSDAVFKAQLDLEILP